MTTTQYLRAFARFWWVVGLCVIVGAVLPIVVGAKTPETYMSSTSVLVTGTPTTQPSSIDAYQVTLLAQQRMPTYDDVASSTTLAEKVLQGLNINLTAAQLTDRTTSDVQTNSTVLKISIKDTQADRAQLLTSRAGTAMVAIINRMEKTQAQSTARLEAKVVADASTPSVSGTTAWRNPFLSGAAGLLIGLALAVGFSRIDPRLRDQDVVADLVDAPVLALVPASQPTRRFVRNGASARYDGAVREVRTGIFFLRKDTDSCLTVAMTSPRPVFGSAHLTRGIAAALADTGVSVLLVDADRGDTVSSENSVQRDEAHGIDVVAADAAAGPAVDLLHSEGFATLLRDAAERYDYVLVNAPATSRGTDAAAVAARCDVTVLTIESGIREGQLREGLRHLRGVDAQVRGVVLLT